MMKLNASMSEQNAETELFDVLHVSLAIYAIQDKPSRPGSSGSWEKVNTFSGENTKKNNQKTIIVKQ